MCLSHAFVQRVYYPIRSSHRHVVGYHILRVSLEKETICGSVFSGQQLDLTTEGHKSTPVRAFIETEGAPTTVPTLYCKCIINRGDGIHIPQFKPFFLCRPHAILKIKLELLR